MLILTKGIIICKTPPLAVMPTPRLKAGGIEQEKTPDMSAAAEIPVGIVIAREDIDSQWEDYTWRPVGVIPGEPGLQPWQELRRGDGWVHFYAGTYTMELFDKETDAYKFNLDGREPVIYVVLSEPDDYDEHDEDTVCPYDVHLVTASPYEAADYLDSGDQIIEPVSMPDSLFALVNAFVDEHHVEVKFKKRKRDEVKLEEHKFGQEPIVQLRKRMRQEN